MRMLQSYYQGRRYLPLFLWLCLLPVPSLVFGSTAKIKSVDLSDIPDWLPYQWETVFNSRGIEGLDEQRLSGSVLVDLDGNGFDEKVVAHKIGIVGGYFPDGVPGGSWQFNLPPEFSWGDRCASLDGVGDLNGDGVPEIFINAHLEDRSLWRFWALDVVAMDTTGIAMLPGPDTWEDGNWDGRYWVAGLIDLPGSVDRRQAYLIGMDAGMDKEPRGLLAVDPFSGDEIWKFLCGPRPIPSTTKVIDLDSDGISEIIFAGFAPGNLNGRKINGTGDNHPMMFVLNADGSLRWQKQFTMEGGSCIFDLIDTNNDGVLDVVLGTTSTNSEENILCSLSGATGEVLGQTKLIHFPTHLDISPSESGDGFDICLLNGKTLRQYSLTHGHFTLLAEVSHSIRLRWLKFVDLVDGPGEEVLVSDTNGNTFLLSNKLELLAYAKEKFPGSYTASLWKPDLGHKWVRFLGGIKNTLTVERLIPSAARPISALWFLLLLPLVLIVVFVVYRKLSKEQLVNTLPEREIRLHLLESLELSGHGAIGSLQLLRRLTWLASTLSAIEGRNERIEAKLPGLVRETRDQALPELRQIINLAKHCNLDDEQVLQAVEALKQIEVTLSDNFGNDGLPGNVDVAVKRLTAAGQSAEDALQALRTEVALHFSADLANSCTNVLDTFSDKLSENKIDVDISGLSADPLFLRIDVQELVFIIDNLIGNAIHAMDGQPKGNLSISGEIVQGLVICDIKDTGCGIVPDDWHRIMEPGSSKREDGGLGLHRSVRILRKYSGSLMVLASELGIGTTFRLCVPLARDNNRNDREES